MSRCLRHWCGGVLLLIGLVTAALGAGLFATPAHAANPTTVSFQGKVVNANGTNVADGTYTFTFKLYTVSSAGTAIWTETDSSVTVTSGVFQVSLGAVCPFFTANTCNGNTPVNFGSSNSLYMGITFNNDAAGEMTPRVQFQSVPYAFNADNLGGVAASGYVQLSPASQQSGNINVNGSITGGSDLTFSAASTATIQPAASQALTITANAASTWSTAAGNLTLQAGSGTISLGTTTTLTASGALTVLSGGTSALTLDSASGYVVSNTGDIINGAGGINTGSGNGTARIDASGNLVNIGNITHASGNITESLGAASNTFTIQSSGSVAYLTVDTANIKVVIGSATTDGTQVLLQLDSFNTFADTATCTTTTNQGALYYNTQSNAVRGCINGNWEDMVSTGALGLQLFGVVPDSGSNNPGDIAGVTGLTDGPCRVYVGSTTSTVAWNGCVAFSGGRKVIVAAGSATATPKNANFQHLCLTGANGQPALSAYGAETANLATVSMPNTTAPILCLADIATSSSAITEVFDTRTYTTTEKEFATAITTAPVLGQLVKVGTTTPGAVTATTTTTDTNIEGVVVATTGATSTTTVNAIVAVSGLAAVKAISGTSNAVGNYIQPSGTAGYATTATTGATTIYSILGTARSAWTGGTTCAVNSNVCAGSILTNVKPR